MLTVKVTGMSCGGCVRSVTNAIQRLEPGCRVEVSLEKGEVVVDGKLSTDQVRSAIEQAGFQVVGG